MKKTLLWLSVFIGGECIICASRTGKSALAYPTNLLRLSFRLRRRGNRLGRP